MDRVCSGDFYFSRYFTIRLNHGWWIGQEFKSDINRKIFFFTLNPHHAGCWSIYQPRFNKYSWFYKEYIGVYPRIYQRSCCWIFIYPLVNRIFSEKIVLYILYLLCCRWCDCIRDLLAKRINQGNLSCFRNWLI